MKDQEGIFLFMYVWVIGWLIVSNMILVILGYSLDDFHVYLSIWLCSAIICLLIYPGIPGKDIVDILRKHDLNEIIVLKEWLLSTFRLERRTEEINT